MLKRMIASVLLLCFLTGCGTAAVNKPAVYEVSYLTLFDTVTTLKGTAESKEAFAEISNQLYGALSYYHQLFDIYNDYEGINNLKTVNDRAGISPVTVAPEIIALLKDCVNYYERTDGKVNIAMGSVLQLWHEARDAGIRDPENAALPDMQKIADAAQHTDIRCLVIDEANSTVYLSDPHARLDVGAIAKGWAVQRVAEKAPAGILISLGGNICCTGPKYADTPWVVGIRDPQGSADDYLHALSVSNGSVVTSGDYQRAYTVDGKTYHHIIDPATGMPASYWRSVSVVCDDSGLADALSTALFLMPLEQGRTLAENCGAQVLWVDADGNQFTTSGFEQLIKS